MTVHSRWGTASWPCRWSLTPLLLRLNIDAKLTRFASNVNPYTAFTSLMLVQGSDNGPARGLDRGEFKEGTSFSTNDFEFFDRSET